MASLNNQYIWYLTVTYDGKIKTVQYPLTCEFNIHRPNQSIAQYCTLNIYNLSIETRMSDFFRQDKQHFNDFGKVKLIEFAVGKENDVTVLFKGVISEAYSTRKNNDVVTTIEAFDNGFGAYNAKPINITFKAGTSFVEAYEYIASQLQYISHYTRGTLEGVFQTDTTFYDSPLNIINQITNGHSFVDNSQLITLNDNECLPGEPIEISANTGLIGIPVARDRWVNANVILNPKLKVGQRVKLKTTSLDYYNDIYRIFHITHQGIISGAVGGQRITTIGMLMNDAFVNSNVNITGQTEYQGEKIVEGVEVKTPGREWVDGVYSYIRKNNGAIPTQKINNLVSWWNMLGNDNKAPDIYKEITPEIISNCIIIANKLQRFINSTDLKGQKITVVSGWRTKKNNKDSGGKSESAHLRGAAIDFKFVSIDTFKAYNTYFKTQWPEFTYPYKYGNNYYIHVQSTKGADGTSRQGVTTYR